MGIFHKSFFVLAIVCLLATVVGSVTGNLSQMGFLAIGIFVALAIAFRANATLKGYSFTIWIFAGITASMFYPQYFVQISGFKTSRLINPLMQIIMFGMGTGMTIQNFIDVVRMPKAVIAGLICHYTIMPLLGFGIAMGLIYGFNVPKEIAAGAILIGCTPCGLASNVMNYIAGNILALAITLTAISTLIAPIVMPALMKLLAGTLVPINFWGMMWNIIKVVIIPVFFGLIFNKLFYGKAKWLTNAMPKVSMFGIAIIIIVITSMGRDDLLKIGGILIFAAIIHNTFGYFLGYWMSRGVFGLDKLTSRTLAIEVGMQNGGLATSVALGMGKAATMGLVPAIFGPWMNISGSMLANWWRANPVKDEKPREEKEVSLAT